jgi:hypothetical protein
MLRIENDDEDTSYQHFEAAGHALWGSRRDLVVPLMEQLEEVSVVIHLDRFVSLLEFKWRQGSPSNSVAIVKFSSAFHLVPDRLEDTSTYSVISGNFAGSLQKAFVLHIFFFFCFWTRKKIQIVEETLQHKISNLFRK